MLLLMQASLQKWQLVQLRPARHLQAALLTCLFDTQTWDVSPSWVRHCCAQQCMASAVVDWTNNECDLIRMYAAVNGCYACRVNLQVEVNLCLFAFKICLAECEVWVYGCAAASSANAACFSNT